MTIDLGGESFAARYAEAVDAIYAAATAPALWPQALQRVADVFDDIGANLVYRRDDNTLGTIVSPGLENAQRDYASGWWQQDIRFARLADRGYLLTSDAFTDHHVASDDEVETHPFYVGFLAVHGLKWVVATSISPDPKLDAILAMQRASTKQRYEDSDLALFGRIGRHVENALRLGIRLITTEVTKLALGDALTRLQVGVFLVDGTGAVVFSNPAAENLIGDRLFVLSGRLRARSAVEHEALQSAIANANLESSQLGGMPKPIVVRGPASKQFLVLHVLPLRFSESRPAEQLFVGARVLIMAIPSASGASVDPALVRDALGLTLAEARVAALIASGRPPREAATRLGITEGTARTTLKRVFAKVGVSRQSELAALLARLTLG